MVLKEINQTIQGLAVHSIPEERIIQLQVQRTHNFFAKIYAMRHVKFHTSEVSLKIQQL